MPSARFSADTFRAATRRPCPIAATGVSSAQRYELHLVQSVWRHAALRAGYVYWNVESDREDNGLSPIKVRFSGPSLGLDLAF